MLVWGKRVADFETRGKPMPAEKSIAGTDGVAGWRGLVIRNKDDGAHCGVLVINP